MSDKTWPFPAAANAPAGETWAPKKQEPNYAGPMHATRSTGGNNSSGPASVSTIASECVSFPTIWPQHPFEPTPIDPVVSSQTATTGGRKFDGGKSQYGLLPVHALEENVKVLTVGAVKYEPDNWKRVPDGKRRYFDAALRHLFAYKRGEEYDPETGLHHLAHALCCIEFMLDLELSPTPENPK